MEAPEFPILNRELILVGLEASTADQAIRILAQNMRDKGYVKDTFVEAVLQREATYPTGMPTEVPVGMPHTDVEHCLRPGISLGILKSPVLFQTMGEPARSVAVNLIFLLSVVNPANQVKVLHRLIDFFQQSAKIRELARVRTADDAMMILRAGLDLDESANSTSDNHQTPPEAACSFEIAINHPSGLHARPAAKFVQAANTFPCDIIIKNLENSKPAVNAKSILSVLSLEISHGHRVRIQAEGEGAEKALKGLKELIESNFGEAME